MTSSDGPRQGLDRGVAALRWLLVSAQDNSSARREALPALSRVTVLVPTVPGATDKLRYLPQPAGGSALVVFTGHDALEHAAKKLGWSQGGSGVSFRAMSGRDALETAQLQGVRAVIIDAAAEHALELKHEEVSDYLSRGTGEFSPESLVPSSRGTGELGQPRKTTPSPARSTGEFSSRGTGERALADLREIGPRKGRDARRDESDRPVKRRASTPTAERAARASKRPSREVKPPRRQTAPMPTTVPTTMPAAAPAQAPTAENTTEKPPRKQNLAEIDDPFISTTPRHAPSAPLSAGGHARRVPSLAAPPLSDEMPSAPFDSSPPPSGTRHADETRSIPASAFKPARDETIPLDNIMNAEAARDSAVRQASLPAEMFGRVDSLPIPARPAQEIIPPTARLPVFEVVPPSVAPSAFSDAPPAAVPGPASVAPAPVVPQPRGTATMPKPPPAEAPRETKAVAVSAESAGGELNDGVLAAIADALRKFPEAEWACVMPDDKHVIAVRVDPSYLDRTSEIEASMFGAAKKLGVAITPMVVSMPGATKDARTRGEMFFPWKKKK